jgi:hypothetical protein
VALLRKVVRFERGFVARAGDLVTVILVIQQGKPDSERAGLQLGKALISAGDLAGKPLRVITHQYANASGLRQTVAQEGAELVYITPRFEAEMPAIATALEGLTVMTICTDGEQVNRGAVLGFELVSARPRLALNLGQAKKQGLDFDSDLFRLVRVVK